jgi:hypothetical protein
VIERDHVEALDGKMVQSLFAAEGMFDLESVARKGPLDQASEAVIVIDIQEPDRWGFGDALAHKLSGT